MDRLPAELYRADQVRRLDHRVAQQLGVSIGELMERAGRAAFERLVLRWPAARRIAVLCGSGNNGGDGYVVARLALQAGLEPVVFRIRGARNPEGEAAAAAERARAAGVTREMLGASLAGFDLVVDGLLGTGLSGSIGGGIAEAIARVEAERLPVLALDIPSGLHADSGRVLGGVLRATETVTFIALKPGLFTGEGPACCGEVHFADLGAPATVYDSDRPAALRWGRTSAATYLPLRSRTAHKGDHGHVLVVGGEQGMAGAARLAAEAAARVGAGLVSVATRGGHAAVLGAGRPELMVHGVEKDREVDALLRRATVVAVGPGLGRGRWGRQMWARVLDSRRPLVVDADGLNLLAGEPFRRADWVLTPHPGEAARLLGTDTEAVQADRLAAAAALRARYGGSTVLKGSGTVVVGGDLPPAICNAGNPGMATGGMGDLLTGAIAGLMAQGLAAPLAARVAVCLHATAGDRAAADGGERGLLASDLLPYLRTLANPSPS